MESIFVRKRMTRDEMFNRYPNKYLLVLDEEDDIGQLDAESGNLTGYVVAAFETHKEACNYSDEETRISEGRNVLHSKDFTEEVFNLGFILVSQRH